MLFNSFNFCIFFSITFILYYFLPPKFNWILLLIASTFFYIYTGAITIIIPLVIILTTYICGIQINKTKHIKLKKLYFLSGLFINIGLLVFFKYINFLIFTALKLLNIIGQASQSVKHDSYFTHLIVPLGISYITFQAIGYLIEINRVNQAPEKNIGLFATYIMFFPKLLSGPIERAHNFLPQLHVKHIFDYAQVAYGFKRIIWGVFKKIVIANRLAIITDSVFNDVQHHSGLSFIIASVFFTFQLYADFSGYTDIAIGTAKMLGFNIMENFNMPFMAKSVSEFWRRWHISLTSWVYDYIYIPIVFKLYNWKKSAVIFAMMVTFLILGFWHGASWNFIIFGFLQGFILSIEFLTNKFRKKIKKVIPLFINNGLGIIFTFLYFSFSLIFFRAKNIKDSLYIIRHLFDNLSSQVIDFSRVLKSFFLNVDLNYQINFNGHLFSLFIDLLLSFLFIIIMLIFHYAQQKKDIIGKLNNRPIWQRWTFYYTLIIITLLFGIYETRQFIYFQF